MKNENELPTDEAIKIPFKINYLRLFHGKMSEWEFSGVENFKKIFQVFLEWNLYFLMRFSLEKFMFCTFCYQPHHDDKMKLHLIAVSKVHGSPFDIAVTCEHRIIPPMLLRARANARVRMFQKIISFAIKLSI